MRVLIGQNLVCNLNAFKGHSRMGNMLDKFITALDRCPIVNPHVGDHSEVRKVPFELIFICRRIEASHEDTGVHDALLESLHVLDLLLVSLCLVHLLASFSIQVLCEVLNGFDSMGRVLKGDVSPGFIFSHLGLESCDLPVANLNVRVDDRSNSFTNGLNYLNGR